MTDIIVIAVVALIVGTAAWYVYRAKKRGVKCVGCPSGSGCSSSCAQSACGSCPSCHSCDSPRRTQGK